MNHTDFIRAFSINRLTSKQDLLSKGGTNNFDQFLTQRERDNQTQARQWHAETRDVRDDAQVAMQRQLTAAGKGITLDHGNSWMTRTFNLLKNLYDSSFRVGI